MSDEEFEDLKSIGTSLYVYNYKVDNPKMVNASLQDIQNQPDYVGMIKMDTENDSIQWIKMLYPVCILCLWCLFLQVAVSFYETL